MIKLLPFLISAAFLLSCNTKLYTEEINRDMLPKYFIVKLENYNTNGKIHTGAFLRIKHEDNDKVSDFMKKHYHRFSYLIHKLSNPIFLKGESRDSAGLNRNLQTIVASDSFYNQFTMLTSGDKVNIEKSKKVFKKADMIKIASRFFYCDGINKKDTSISYHICVGINGVADLNLPFDYTCLEAFCFEAVFNKATAKSKTRKRLHHYINEVAAVQKKVFIDFDSYLLKMKEQCFVLMENDDELGSMLLKYYNSNKENLGFIIQ